MGPIFFNIKIKSHKLNIISHARVLAHKRWKARDASLRSSLKLESYGGADSRWVKPLSIAESRANLKLCSIFLLHLYGAAQI